MKKTFTIIIHRHGHIRETSGTVEELTRYFAYTLEVGESWQHEKGNHKINRHPKSAKALVNNISWAENNAARNGYSGTYYELAAEQN